MSDLISRQAALDAIADYLSKTTYTSSISYLNTGALILARVPSADVVEVVRCKDCRHADRYYHCIFSAVWSDKNHYCSYGERKDE